MSLVCRTLVFVEIPDTLRIIAQAFPHPKYELEFVHSAEEANAHALSNRMDLFIVDSALADDVRIESIRRYMPTLFVEPDYTRAVDREGVLGEEADKMRVAAEKLLRKNYISWIIDALEFSS